MKIDWHCNRSFVYGTWEPEVVRAVCGQVHPKSVALDVGGHIGYFALLVGKLVGPEGTVVAFEPVPQNFVVLAENVQLNSCHWVRAITIAVLDRACTVQARVPEDDAFPFTIHGGGAFGCRDDI
jgi:Methyltransferase FkbM domain